MIPQPRDAGSPSVTTIEAHVLFGGNWDQTEEEGTQEKAPCDAACQGGTRAQPGADRQEYIYNKYAPRLAKM